MSWMVTRKSDGQVRECFDKPSMKIFLQLPDKYKVETALKYLVRINKQIKESENG